MSAFGPELMTQTIDHPRILDDVQAAVEASCDALITLERLAADLADQATGASGLREQVADAVQCLRNTIAELRSGQGGVAIGFVLERAAGAGSRRQSSPRRTA